MALTALLEPSTLINFVKPLAIILVFALVSLGIERLFLHPLASIPGPLSTRLTSLWTYIHSYLGDECTLITALHAAYGPVVRVAPNEVCISDGAALAPIYSEKGGFAKAACYRNFDIDGFASLFSETERELRAPKAKSVVALFSTANLREGEEVLERCVERLVQRLRAEKEENIRTAGRKKVNVLNLGRSLAVDAVTAYLFRKSYDGLGEEKSGQLSASEFVNAFVAVGRFFYLPNWLFTAVEMATEKLFGTQEVVESMNKVDEFVKQVVNDADPEDGTYAGRMLHAGLGKAEIAAQCKDLMFAGTDSSGMNLSTFCWQLAKNPKAYATLRKEITTARQEDASYDPATLPYLRACLREALRLSMANPTRLPRVVPAGGWNFHSSISGKSYHLPSGTLVSCQIHTLHHNANVFPDPFAFKPERWLETKEHSPSPEMQRDFIPFSLGARQCIARNLAMTELVLAGRGIIESGVLDGAKAVGDKIEILEWFNSKVPGETIELTWV